MLKAKTSKRASLTALAMVAFTEWSTPTFAQTEQAAPQGDAVTAQPTPAPTGPAEAEPIPAPPSPAPLAPLPPPPPQVPGTNPYGGNPYGAQPYGGGYQSGWPNGITRPFSFTLGAGAGFLSGSDGTNRESDLGALYAFRVGIGFAPNISLTLGWEGVSVRKRDKETNENARFSQDAFLVGIQYFVTPRLNLRGGFGSASVSEDAPSVSRLDSGGIAGSAAIGYDIVSQLNFALAVELSATAAQYADYTFTMGGVGLTLSFF